LDEAQRLVLGWPPSVNGYWRQFQGRTILSKAGRLYKQSPAPSFQRYTAQDRLAISIEYYPPSKAARDLDNHAKAVLDLLMHWGVFPDDSQVDELHLYRRDIQRPGRAEVTISKL